MNLRPLAPKASALPNCATSRFRYSVLFCYGFTQFGFNWKLAPLHSPSALHPDFDIQFCFVMGSRSLVLIGNWLRFTRQVRYIPISIFSFVLLLGSRSLVLIGIWLRFTRQVRSAQSQKTFIWLTVRLYQK